jgi:hypothetical protein
MDAFYVIVLSVAVLLLILILTYIGVKMTDKSSNLSVYPPASQSCPDYWTQIAGTKKCSIPNNRKNAQMISNNDPSTRGMTGNTIDFDDAGWENNGKTKLCNQKEWAIKNRIQWDGVSNYNGC